VLHPNQFEVNEAWIAFQLNETPIQTARDGEFNCVCLMDAASCFILANALVPVYESEPSILEVQRLLRTAWDHKQEFPSKLFITVGQFQTNLPEESGRQGIEVVRMPEGQLLPFIREARQSFKQHMVAQRWPLN
jgi:hypothetical protein